MGIKQLVSENTKNNELNLTFSRLCDIRERPDRSLGGLAFDPFFPNNSQIHKLCHPTHLSSPQAMDRDWQKVRTAFGAESYPESSIEDSLRLQAIRGALREDTSRRLHSALYSVVENPIFSSRTSAEPNQSFEAAAARLEFLRGQHRHLENPINAVGRSSTYERSADEPQQTVGVEGSADRISTNHVEMLEMIQQLIHQNRDLLDITRRQQLLLMHYEGGIVEANDDRTPSDDRHPPPIAATQRQARLQSPTKAAATHPEDRLSVSFSLSRPKDELYLTEYQRLARNCLEFFQASKEDVDTGVQGRKKNKIRLKQVGIRCIFCRHVPIRLRQRGNVYFPNSLKGIYQAANNMAGTHLIGGCAHIPNPTKEKLIRTRAKQEESLVGKKYWMTSSVEQGLEEKDEALWLI